MSYVENQLLPGEQIKYQAHLHKAIYILPAAAAAVLVILGLGALANELMATGAIAVAMAGVIGLICYLHYSSSEFAITNKRVIIKVGFIQRRTLETLLTKVEGIGVDQSVFGRMLGFGTITVTGTGGTREPFANIADPLEFRRQVQAQVTSADQHVHPVIASGPPREERDCPYCAERILTRAKVCKHCGRDVQPLAAE